MDSTPNLKLADPPDVLTERTDEALAQIYEQITRAGKQPSQPAYDSVPHPSDPQLPVDTFRPAASRGRRTRRQAVGLLLAASIGGAVIASQSSYGGAAKLIFARWVPQLIPMSSQLPEKSGLPDQPSRSTVQIASPEPTQPPTQAQTTPQDLAAAAPVQPELAQSLQVIMRDLANVEQEIKQLKANQAQTSRDNAQIAEQVKASQEQMASIVAKASGHDPRPKTSAPPAQPITALRSKPVRTPPLPQGATRPLSTRPQAPSQLRAEKP
jgi:hypothetical protein